MYNMSTPFVESLNSWRWQPFWQRRLSFFIMYCEGRYVTI